ncbi:hypothetical protein BDR05DRAFT_946024 [Suillus weaverae]|nr:hypothetical protein BDR05DRAFT_946024 [Suillus weaverae]
MCGPAADISLEDPRNGNRDRKSLERCIGWICCVVVLERVVSSQALSLGAARSTRRNSGLDWRARRSHARSYQYEGERTHFEGSASWTATTDVSTLNLSKSPDSLLSVLPTFKCVLEKTTANHLLHGTMAEWLRREIRTTDISYGFRFAANTYFDVNTYILLDLHHLGRRHQLIPCHDPVDPDPFVQSSLPSTASLLLQIEPTQQMFLIVRPWNYHNLGLPDFADAAQSVDDWSEAESPSEESIGG